MRKRQPLKNMAGKNSWSSLKSVWPSRPNDTRGETAGLARGAALLLGTEATIQRAFVSAALPQDTALPSRSGKSVNTATMMITRPWARVILKSRSVICGVLRSEEHTSELQSRGHLV